MATKILYYKVFHRTSISNRNKKNRDTYLVKKERRRNYLVWQPKYYTTKFFTEHLLAIEIKKTEILMNKPVYLGLLIKKLSKILI